MLTPATGIEYTYPSQNPRHDAAVSEPPKGANSLISGQEISFGDILDIINPLQHLPVIGNMYRAITGDTISAGAQMAGGALFGGPIGLLTSAINAGLEAATGQNAGGHLLALLGGDPPAQFANANAAYIKAQQLS